MPGEAALDVTTWDFVFRLLLAAIMGGLIGLEREIRAKEAGLRTHFLVALGSALLMIVSQWGFQGAEDIPGTRHADVARVAAQIVSGIGFLGAGTIIVQKQSVRGLTTAAGLWVAAGIGMAIGGGLYVVGLVGTGLTLLGLELFHLLRNVKSQYATVVFRTEKRDNLLKVTSALNDQGYRIINCSVSTESRPGGEESLRVKMFMRGHSFNDENHLLLFMHQVSGITVEKIE